MNFASIRWRLPASYAAVALLAALALGSLMLVVLNGYYSRQERAFLLSNAEAARPMVEAALQNNQPALQDQVLGLAFLTQTQIRVLDGAGNILADSGTPMANQVVSLSANPEGMTMLSVGDSAVIQEDGNLPIEAQLSTSAVIIDGAGLGETLAISGSGQVIVPVSSSPFGYGLVEARSPKTQRSAQVVRIPLLGQPGNLEISNGPAYGRDILQAVALAWLLASLAAVALAGLAGMAASRQVTRPVLALTEAARQMQVGNLDSRVALDGRPVQEFSVLADNFNAMAQRVEDTVSTLRAFISDAAHELNTPLTALHTNLELTLNEPDGEERQRFLQQAIQQNARLERLASGLLDLSRLEADQNAPDFTPLDLTRLVAESTERFASRAEQAERNFSLELPTAALPVQGNALQLQRMLDNLLENALKFTPPGGAIRLSLQQNAGQAVLRVNDNGIGILAGDLPYLFERFHRGRNSVEYPGAGLGLAIVRAIVAIHGGEVEAYSAGRDQGSQFTVHLPAGN